MSIAEAKHSNSQQEHCEHNHHKKASRLRGGGAGKVWWPFYCASFLFVPLRCFCFLRHGAPADTPSCSPFRIVSWASLAVSFALVSGARMKPLSSTELCLHKQSVVKYVVPFLFRWLDIHIYLVLLRLCRRYTLWVPLSLPDSFKI